MTVVLATPGSLATMDRTIECLACQTVAHELELLLVVPDHADSGEPGVSLERFHSHRVVEIGPFERVGTGYAAGAAAAAGEVVALGEDHSYPEPGWAEALIDRHREPWGAVGAVIANANPGSAASWADILAAFGPFVEQASGGEVGSLPGHNTSYKVRALPASASVLEDGLNDEWQLHRWMAARGDRLYLEPRAVTRHVNFAAIRPWTSNQFWNGWATATERSARWPARRRAAYALAWPLIAAIRLRAVLRDLARVREAVELPPGVAPMVVAALLLDAAGQGTGFLTGIRPKLAEGELRREFERVNHIRPADRQALGLDET
jgi:hypothetical protein